MPYFSIHLDNGERYDLLHTKPEEGVKAVAHYDQETGETVGFYKIKDMLEGDNL